MVSMILAVSYASVCTALTSLNFWQSGRRSCFLYNVVNNNNYKGYNNAIIIVIRRREAHKVGLDLRHALGERVVDLGNPAHEVAEDNIAYNHVLFAHLG